MNRCEKYEVVTIQVRKATMSSPKRKGKLSKRKPRAKMPVSPLGDRVEIFVRKTGISKPTTYRLMASGKLRYAQVTERIRLIPTTEYERLGLTDSTRVVGE